ncbi:hypothetical protein [Pseudomonas putida]|uniref:Uncharacterized protein n=1 Tax=Pseudomonas putida TaxID=303 RepID=A0A7V8EBX3_PSEPU|nr:hypothetical protein [Pseudomonas putida]KAF0251976.1 hypothetical protein GN299_25380 [Pseudomonas putida]
MFAQFLCLGFAMALEVVPALILAGVRSSVRHDRHDVVSAASETPSFDTASQPDRESEMLETPKTAETLPDSNAEILKILVAQTKKLAPGSPVKIKEFAKNSRIGNLRAGTIFKEAESLGVIKKTTIGYVAT